MSENLLNNSEIRDEKGRLLPGAVINPAGKPKGSRHFSTLFKEAVQRIAEGEEEADDKIIVKSVIEKAKKGDLKASDMIFDRVDGKPPQSMDLTTDGEKIGEIDPKRAALIEKFEEELKKLKT